MSSSKQIEANRRNATKSTGPKSEEGKTRVSLNPLRHGLLSKKALLPDEDAEEFMEFAENIRVSTAPVGELEGVLADRVIVSLWRMRRSVEIETQLYQEREDEYDFLNKIKGTRAGSFNINATLFQNLSRYEGSVERSLYKALHELQRMQALRNGITSAVPVAIDVGGSLSVADVLD